MPTAVPREAVPLVSPFSDNKAPCPLELEPEKGDILGPGLTSGVFFRERRGGISFVSLGIIHTHVAEHKKHEP